MQLKAFKIFTSLVSLSHLHSKCFILVWASAQIDVRTMGNCPCQKLFTAFTKHQAQSKFHLSPHIWPNLNEKKKTTKKKQHTFLAPWQPRLVFCVCACGVATFKTLCVWLKSQCLLLFAAFFIVAAEKPQWSLLPWKQTRQPQIGLCSVQFCKWRLAWARIRLETV